MNTWARCLFLIPLVLSLSGSFGQDVCHPELTPFEVHRLQLEDGWLHTTGGMANESRVIEVDYLDNRRIDVFEFICYGSVTLTNANPDLDSNAGRRVKFRQRVFINRGQTTRYLQTQTRLMFAYRTMGRQRMSSCIPTRHWNQASLTHKSGTTV